MTAPSPHLAIREDWLARHTEDAIDPALPIVDAHHHLWDHPKPRYLLDEVLADFRSGHNIVASVFVECRAMYRRGGDESHRSLGETEFANGMAAMAASGPDGTPRVCDGIVGHVDLSLGGAALGLLERHLAVSGGRLRGIRNITAWHEHPEVRTTPVLYRADLFDDPQFHAGLRHLTRLGLVFDSWQYHTQLGALARLAQAWPDTRIVVNHTGGPIGVGPYAPPNPAAFAEWRCGLRELAQRPNIFLKLGGLGMRVNGFDFHTRATPPSSQDLAEAWRPYVDEAITAFSPARCMFESNFPVDKGSYSYGVLWNAFKQLARHATPTQRADLFHGTAARVYGLTLPWA
ncbi:MAG: amidohydrolase family protein [Burkholderiales bacterium]|nr:amidohydrolase family protein [Burkholderiales bacterium]